MDLRLTRPSRAARLATDPLDCAGQMCPALAMAEPKASSRREVHLMADRATYDDMKAAADLTGIPVSRLYDQGAKLRLDQLRADAAPVVEEAERKLREKRRGR